MSGPWKDAWAYDAEREVWGVPCPVCGDTVLLLVDSVEETVGTTFDCSHCDALLLHSAEDGVVCMHAYLHSRDPRWPADGTGTGYVDACGKPSDPEEGQ